MNKQKALHALRGLEMTSEQKQEFINALAEGDKSGGGNNTGKVIIDVTPIEKGNGAEMSITEEQLNAILTQNAVFIITKDFENHILRPRYYVNNDEGFSICFQYTIDRDVEFSVIPDQLKLITPIFG